MKLVRASNICEKIAEPDEIHIKLIDETGDALAISRIASYVTKINAIRGEDGVPEMQLCLANSGHPRIDQKYLYRNELFSLSDIINLLEYGDSTYGIMVYDLDTEEYIDIPNPDDPDDSPTGDALDITLEDFVYRIQFLKSDEEGNTDGFDIQFDVSCDAAVLFVSNERPLPKCNDALFTHEKG